MTLPAFTARGPFGITSAEQRPGSGPSYQATRPKLCGCGRNARGCDSTKVFSVVARRYVRKVYPTKSVQTRLDNDKELANLLKVFAHMPIDAIAPMHIREYMDIRGQVAKVRANREKALFSHLVNKAREWGYTAPQNPCQGVKGFKETGRSRYITDAEFDQVKAQAHFTVVDVMALALLTGQRPADGSNSNAPTFGTGRCGSCRTKLARAWALKLPANWRPSSPELMSVHATRSAPI